MKKSVLFITILLLFALDAKTQVAVNTDGSSANSSAMLDVKSTDKGMLIPRMTIAQRDGITSPVQGLIVYITDDNSFYYYNSSSWQKIENGSSVWSENGSTIYADSTKKVVVGNNNGTGVFQVITDKATGTFTSDQCNGGTATAQEQAAGKPAENAFDNDDNTYWSNDGNLSVWLQYDFGSNPKIIRKYRILYVSGSFDASPNDWQFQATNELGNWTILNTETGQGWIHSDWKEFGMDNTTQYRYYRIVITDNTGSSDDYVYINEMEMKEAEYTKHNTLFVNDNKVGIGTDDPSTDLEVNGGFRLVNGTEGTGKILSSNSSGDVAWVDGTTVNGGGWTVSNNYIYNASDSVGIGISTPHAPLEVHGRISQTGTGQSVFLGEKAGANVNKDNNNNVFIGYYAGFSDTSGWHNTAIGYHSLYLNTSGYNNTGIGYNTLAANITGTNNIAFGEHALQNNTVGSSNLAIGSSALSINTTSSGNVALGDAALEYNHTGNFNTAIGFGALSSDTSGDNNIAIGKNAGDNLMIGYNNIIIGTNSIDLPAINGSGQLDIGNIIYGINIDGTGNTVSTGNIGIGVQTPVAKLDVNGKIKIGDDTETPQAGTIRWNSNSQNFEGFTGTKWVSFGNNNGGWGNNTAHETSSNCPSDGNVDDYFGGSVSINGDYAIVGADNKKVGSNLAQGKAYIYYRSGTTWSEQAQLTASDGAANDRFGCSVSINGDYAIVGAYGKDVGSNSYQGKAYIYYRSGTTWSEQAQLTASDGAANDLFGYSVSINGDYAIVGAIWKDVGNNPDQGKAYIYHRSGTIWSEQAQLTASDGTANDSVGYSVSINGDYAIVGACNKDVGSNSYQGKAYIYHRSGTTWSEQAQLTASDGAEYDLFGYSVSINGDYAIVGAFDKDYTWGAAYIFYRYGTTWSEQAKLIASDGTGGDYFGYSVSIDGNYTISGAFYKYNKMGAVYFFKHN